MGEGPSAALPALRSGPPARGLLRVLRLECSRRPPGLLPGCSPLGCLSLIVWFLSAPWGRPCRPTSHATCQGWVWVRSQACRGAAPGSPPASLALMPVRQTPLAWLPCFPDLLLAELLRRCFLGAAGVPRHRRSSFVCGSGRGTLAIACDAGVGDDSSGDFSPHNLWGDKFSRAAGSRT